MACLRIRPKVRGMPIQRTFVVAHLSARSFMLSSDGQTYYWQVQSVALEGLQRIPACSSFSVSTDAPAVPPLTSPSSGSSLAAGTTPVSLPWSSVSGGSGCNVSVYTGCCGGTFLNGLSTSITNFTLTGLSNGQTCSCESPRRRCSAPASADENGTYQFGRKCTRMHADKTRSEI